MLNLAAAYLLAGNRVGLDGLRARFGTAMADTPLAGEFRLFTDPESSADDVDTLRSEIAALDDYQAFMDTYRQRWASGDPVIN